MSRSEPHLLPQDMPPEAISILIDEYLGGISDIPSKRNTFQELLGDAFINFPVLDFSRNLRGEPIPVQLPHPSHFSTRTGLSQVTWPHTPLLPPHPASSLGGNVTVMRGDSGRALCRGENQGSERCSDLSEVTQQGPSPILGVHLTPE